MHTLPDQGEWGNHLKILMACAGKTDKPILELGTGVHSTPALAELAIREKRRVVAWEQDPEWYHKAKGLENEFFQIHLLPCTFHGYPDWNMAGYETEDWGVALVDQAPVSGRLVAVSALAHRCDFIVCHDTEEGPGRRYFWEPLLSTFQHRFDDGQDPQTTVVSNAHQVHPLLSTRQIFTDIYARNVWGNGSGSGATPHATERWRAWLEEYLETHRISKVVDLGCGDWQSTRLVDFKGAAYLGVDVVESVIRKNEREFGGRKNVTFKLVSGWEGLELQAAAGSLLIVKDVLQHWSNDTILSFLAWVRVAGFDHVVVTTDTCGSLNPNGCILNGGHRSVQFAESPFFQSTTILLRDGQKMTFEIDV